MWPFALQNMAFYDVKDGILQRKTYAFRLKA